MQCSRCKDGRQWCGTLDQELKKCWARHYWVKAHLKDQWESERAEACIWKFTMRLGSERTKTVSTKMLRRASWKPLSPDTTNIYCVLSKFESVSTGIEEGFSRFLWSSRSSTRTGIQRDCLWKRLYRREKVSRQTGYSLNLRREGTCASRIARPTSRRIIRRREEVNGSL
jgi:hypothetical protein